MSDNKISLTSEREIRIFTDPLRQRLLAQMEILGIPVTAKKLADALGITPSSAKHHLLQLQSIGLVEVDHLETIRGIVATFYRRTGREIYLHAEVPGLEREKALAMENDLRMVQEGFWQSIDASRTAGQPLPWGTTDRSGVLHLTREEMDELQAVINTYLEAHHAPKPGTHPIRFAMLCYDAGGRDDEVR